MSHQLIYPALSALAVVSHAGIASYFMSGVMTEQSFAKVRADLSALPVNPCAGFIAAMPNAVIAMASADWGNPTACPLASRPPGAILVRPDDLEAAERYAMLLRQRGYQRQAFTCERAAQLWIEAQAEIRAQQAAWLAIRPHGRL